MTGAFRVLPLLCACLFAVTFTSSAQLAKDYIQKGDRYFEKKDYENALKFFEQALAIEPDRAMTNYKAGICCNDRKQFAKAVACLEKAYRLQPDLDPDIHYHLGIAYQNDHRYADAISQFEALRGKNKRLAPIATRKIAECIAADSLMKLPSTATVKAIAGEVNTNFSEFAPVICPDGKTIIFSSNRSVEDYEIKSRTNFDDVYIGRRQGQSWGGIGKISDNINVRLNEVATSISADGTTLYLYYEDGGGDIYTSTRENATWSKPIPLNRFINHPAYRESAATISGDGKRLYFSSNRPGGKGGFDIYVSELGANGQWGRPSNLGSPVNTRKDEISPFIHDDGQTLYFASDGHTTLGDHDLFRSRLQNGKWTMPENLGYPVNSSAYEGFLTISPDGRTGYFTSKRKPGQSDTDIYEVTFMPSQPETPDVDDEDSSDDGGLVTVLSGSVVDASDATPLEATIALVNNSTRKVISRIHTDPSGAFRIVIPRGGNYGLTTERPGYLFNSMNFDLPPFDKHQEIDTHILMVKAQVGSKVVLKNVFFDVNQSTLKDESISELENIRDLLLRYPEWKVRINGHTDNVGKPETNRVLSLKRAEAVVAYLIRQGIPAARLEAKGFGSDRPLVSNDDEKEGRQINRRTEIEIIE